MNLENKNDDNNDNDNDEQTWVLDLLIGFLKSPLWSTSLNDFIDRHSIIFDPDEIEDDDGNVKHDHQEYINIFHQYRRLVDQLIGSHMIELGINEQQFAKACQMAEGMLAKKLKRILFEELWAAENYDVFVRLMAKRNVELQLEALEILVRKYGLVYDVFVPEGQSANNFLSDDHVLREAIIRSLNDMALENENDDDDDIIHFNKSIKSEKIIEKKVKVDIENDNVSETKNNDEKDGEDNDDEITENTDKDTVQRDAVRLAEVKQKFDQKMTDALQSAFMNDQKDVDDDRELNKQEQQQKLQMPITTTKSKDSCISAEDIHKRADYLRTQRDKILRQRQKERTERISKYLIKEKQKQKQSKIIDEKLSTDNDKNIDDKNNNQNTDGNNNGDDVNLAFRKSLAARLKAEVILGANTTENKN